MTLIEYVVVLIVMLAVFVAFAVLAARQARRLAGANQAVLIGAAIVVGVLNGYALVVGSTETSLVAIVLTAVNMVFLTRLAPGN